MNRRIWSSVIVLGLTGGCELVAGIQDRYLVADPGDATTGDADSTHDDSATRTDGESSIDSQDAAPTEGGATDATTGQDAATVVDAAAPVDAPTIVDAGTDAATAIVEATTPDAGSGNFTPPDAGTVDPSAPCSQQGTTLFCEDFDEETAVAQDWLYEIDTVDGGSLAFFMGAYTSPPRSMQVTSPVAPSSSVLDVLGKQLTTSLTSRFSLAFDVRLEMNTLAGLPLTTIAQMIAQRQGVPMQFNFEISSSGSDLQAFTSADGGGAATMITLPALPLRQWTRVVLAYDASTGITITEDGLVVGTNAAVGGAPGTLQFQMGMVFQIPPGTAPQQFEMDNIVVRGL